MAALSGAGAAGLCLRFPCNRHHYTRGRATGASGLQGAPLAHSPDCSTLLLQVFMLPADAKCNEETLTAVLKSGHSRLPIHKPGNK